MSQPLKTVAIQGWPGANHDIAARAFFGSEEIELEPCLTFGELFQKIDKNVDMLGMVAIENTLVGSLLANYTLLKDSGLSVLGEHKLRIKHQLMALPGQTIGDIREVHSHPMALAQCEMFFKEHPHIRLVESEDTALSAKLISEGGIKGIAAIASGLAAKLYKLEIIGKDIETNKHNYTRFLVVGRPDSLEHTRLMEAGRLNKASVVFSVPHEEGSLSKVLTILAFYNINLSKIQSLPIVGQEWQYLMYIDVDFSNYQRYLQALDAIRPLCEKFRVLGEYEAADTLYETNGGQTVKKAETLS
jgi:prephenate dehydratase